MGVRRCGVVEHRSSHSTTTLAAVVVDALADLDAVPVRARVGQWISFSAAMLAPASGARLYVEGPRGGLFTVPTTLHDGRVHASVPLGSAGEFRLQLVAATLGGPRPILEASVFADAKPPARVAIDRPETRTDVAPARVLLELLADSRRVRSLPPLLELPLLDEVAREHAERMRSARRLVHDTGNGSPTGRVLSEGLEPRLVGENVAHERTAALAHLALWSSLSHRQNLLDPRFTAVGIGVAPDADGSLWVAQLFADFSTTGILAATKHPIGRFASDPGD